MITKKKQNNEGFSLIEIILATAIFIMMVSGLAGSLVYGIQLSFQSGAKSQAAYIAQEGVEIFRNLRDESFFNLSDGTYGIEISGNSYEIVSGNDTTGEYIRTITVSTIDADTKMIESEVTWDQELRGSGSVKLVSYLTNWRTIANKAGMLVYSDNSVAKVNIKYRLLYDDYTWGPELQIPDYGAPTGNDVRGIKLYSNPDKDEKILIVKNGETPGTLQNLYAIVWRGSGWGNIVHLASYSNTNYPWIKNFDGTYLENGNFLLVYDDNTSTPKHRTWNGSSWSSQESTLDITNTEFWVVVRNKPGTNEAMIAIKDSSQKNKTMYFNGSSFSGLTVHGTQSPALYGENIDFIWNQENPDEGFLVYNEEYDCKPNIKKWNGSWQAEVENIGVDGFTTHTRIIQRPGHESFINCTKDDDRDINCLLTDNTPLWEESENGEIAKWTHDNFETSFDLAYETSGTNALVVYANGTGVAQRRISKYRYFNPSTNTWSPEFEGITLGPTEASAMETVRLIPHPENDYIMVIMAASDQDIWTNVWNGESNTFFTSDTLGPIEQGLYGSQDEDYWFDFAWD